MRDDGYTTPEGHWLPKPLLMPDARGFADVLEYVAEWDNETMSHRSGHLPADSPRPEPRYLPETTPEASAWEKQAWRTTHGRNEIGPYCSVDLSQLGGPRHRSIAVRATDAVMQALAPRVVTPDDHISFNLIGHGDRGRVLVIAQHSYIIGDHWLAYIDPATVPAYPYAARDARKAEIVAALEADGHRPFRRDHPGGDIEITARDAPPLGAVIHADGSVTRTWADGTTALETAAALP
jgi:hypothetical protein